jgi:hypothetical protein
MLACRSLTAIKAEYCRKSEKAVSHTRNRHGISKLLKGNHGKTVAPTLNYMDLKLNYGTYCGLLLSIFWDHCKYYTELLKIYCILECKECFIIQEAYTKVCAWITWAIVDDGRSFFGCNLVTSDFAPGSNHFFSALFYEGITNAICNALTIQLATFPRECLSTAAPEVMHGRLGHNQASPCPPPVLWPTTAPASPLPWP